MSRAQQFLDDFEVESNGPSTVVNPAYALSANSAFLLDEQTLDLAGGETAEVRTLYSVILDRTWRRYVFDRNSTAAWPGDKVACMLSLSKEMVERRLTPAQVHAAERVIVATHRVFGEHFLLVHALLKMARDPSGHESAQRYLHRASSVLAFTVRRAELASAQTLLDTLHEDRLSHSQIATKQMLRKALTWRMREAQV
jgi:hypothetical protein